MNDSDRYTGIADQMLRFATSALSDVERRSYLELSAEWRRLAAEAAAFEKRRAAAEPAAAADEVVPYPPDDAREA
jgi:hypothetical protein